MDRLLSSLDNALRTLDELSARLQTRTAELQASDGERILATTEAMCRSRPHFMTREAWMQSIQAKLDAR